MSDYPEIYFIAGLAAAIVCGLIGRALAESKGRAGAGFWLGFLFGPIGIVIALLLPEQARPAASSVGPIGEFDASNLSRKCPACAETIKLEALKCRYCGTEFDKDLVAAEVAAQRADFQERKARGDHCPKCGSVLALNRDYAGRRFCPVCNDHTGRNA